MLKALQAIFVITLAISIAGGILFVAVQLIGLLPGNLEFFTTMNTLIKPPLVIVCSICAIASFLMHYFEQAESEETAEGVES